MSVSECVGVGDGVGVGLRVIVSKCVGVTVLV